MSQQQIISDYEAVRSELEAVRAELCQAQDAAKVNLEYKNTIAKCQKQIEQMTVSLQYYRRCSAEDSQTINQLHREKKELMDRIDKLEQSHRLVKVKSRQSVKIDQCKQMNHMIYKENQQLLADIYEMCILSNQKDERIQQLNMSIEQMNTELESLKIQNQSLRNTLAHVQQQPGAMSSLISQSQEKAAALLNNDSEDRMSRTRKPEYSIDTRPVSELKPPAQPMKNESESVVNYNNESLLSEIHQLKSELLNEKKNNNLLIRQVTNLTQELLKQERIALENSAKLNYMNMALIKTENEIESQSKISIIESKNTQNEDQQKKNRSRVKGLIQDQKRGGLSSSCKSNPQIPRNNSILIEGHGQSRHCHHNTYHNFRFNFKEFPKVQSTIKESNNKTQTHFSVTRSITPNHSQRISKGLAPSSQTIEPYSPGTIGFIDLCNTGELNLPWLYTIMLRISEACENMILRFKEYFHLHPSQILLHGLNSNKPDLLYLDVFEFTGSDEALQPFFAPEIFHGDMMSEASMVWNIGVLFDMLIHQGSLYFQSPEDVVDPAKPYKTRDSRNMQLVRLLEKVMNKDPEQRIKLSHMITNIKYQLKRSRTTRSGCNLYI